MLLPQTISTSEIKKIKKKHKIEQFQAVKQVLHTVEG